MMKSGEQAQLNLHEQIDGLISIAENEREYLDRYYRSLFGLFGTNFDVAKVQEMPPTDLNSKIDKLRGIMRDNETRSGKLTELIGVDANSPNQLPKAAGIGRGL